MARYKHLAPKTSSGEMALRGRRLTVRSLVGQIQANGLSVDDAAREFDLSAPAIREALSYAKSHPDIIAAAAECEKQALEEVSVTRIQVRVREALARQIVERTGAGGEPNLHARTALARYYELVRSVLPLPFGREEAFLIVDSASGLVLTLDEDRATPSALRAYLIAEVSDNDRLNGAGERFGLSAGAVERLIRTLTTLSPLQIYATVDACERFLANPSDDVSDVGLTRAGSGAAEPRETE